MFDKLQAPLGHMTSPSEKLLNVTGWIYSKATIQASQMNTMNDNSSWYKKCCSIALVCEIVSSNQFKQTNVTQKLTFSAKHSLDNLS